MIPEKLSHAENNVSASSPIVAANEGPLSDNAEKAALTNDSGDARVVVWDTLARGERCLLIRHNGQEYCLRETRNGKLILTK